MNDRNIQPRPVTKAYLERAALHYLSRYSATEARLAEVLARKVLRRCPGLEAPTDEQSEWIVEVVARCVNLGYVNDATYARSRAARMIARGRPPHQIARDLRSKGVDRSLVESILADMSEEFGEGRLALEAGIAYARRRRFGPFRRQDSPVPPDRARKERDAMLRSGFSPDVVRRVLEADDEEDFPPGADCS